MLLAQTYLQYLVWRFPAALGFWIFKEVTSALKHPQVLTVTTVVELLLNAVANYILIFGEFNQSSNSDALFQRLE